MAEPSLQTRLPKKGKNDKRYASILYYELDKYRLLKTSAKKE